MNMDWVNLEVECPICHNGHIVTVRECDYEEFNSPNRRKVQDIFPYLSADEREILMTGICPKCWDEMWA